MDDDKTHAFAVSLFDFTLCNVTTHPPVFGLWLPPRQYPTPRIVNQLMACPEVITALKTGRGAQHRVLRRCSVREKSLQSHKEERLASPSTRWKSCPLSALASRRRGQVEASELDYLDSEEGVP